jgi:hypothetical protein
MQLEMDYCVARETTKKKVEGESEAGPSTMFWARFCKYTSVGRRCKTNIYLTRIFLQIRAHEFNEATIA